MNDQHVTVLTEPLGGSSLAHASLDGAAPEWFGRRPTTPSAWRARAEETGSTAPDGWLDRLRPALAASGAAAARLARVADGRGVVVTTGQQPGLFGGPVYTWSKAISALALADALEEATGIPVAPVFWAATDDSDLAEASTTWVSLNGGAEELRLGGLSSDMEGRAMAEVPLPDLSEQLATLRRAGGSVSNASPLELVESAYKAGVTVGDAYLMLLRGLLEPLGIAVLDASHPSVRTAARPLLVTALRRAQELERALKDRTTEIERRGFVPQVPQVDGLSPVFVYEPEGRRRVPVTETESIAANGDAVLGPNVLLRPVMERAILPTVAYVAGPGELAYFAQVSAVADALDQPLPLAVPRWSALIIEPHVAGLLERYGLDPSDLADAHAPERALAEGLVPEGIRNAIAGLRAALETATRTLLELNETEDGELVPASVPPGAAAAMGHRLDRLERRYRAAVRRRERRAFTDLSTLRGALRPGGARQERALNLLPLLARHGRPLLDAMRQAARAHADALVGLASGANEGTKGGALATESSGGS